MARTPFEKSGTVGNPNTRTGAPARGYTTVKAAAPRDGEPEMPTEVEVVMEVKEEVKTEEKPRGRRKSKKAAE